MESVWKWLGRFSITTHSVTAAAATVVGAYAAVPQFHALVLSWYKALPAGIEETVGAAVAVYMWYHSGKKQPPAAAQLEAEKASATVSGTTAP
jgi:hypothetical protein